MIIKCLVAVSESILVRHICSCSPVIDEFAYLEFIIGCNKDINYSPRIGLHFEHLQYISIITSRVCLNKKETEIRLRKFYSETGQAALVFTHEWNQKQYQLQLKTLHV